jgi:hypothetical protein
LDKVHISGKCVTLYPNQLSRFTKKKGELKFLRAIIGVGDDYPFEVY